MPAISKLTDSDRFDTFLRQAGDCLIWIGGKAGGRAEHQRYGCFKRSRQRQQVYAHRYAYERANNHPIPDGMIVRHSCDNPLCCNPEHLLLGTQKDNMTDASLRGRTTRGERSASAKLTKHDVVQIRELLRRGGRHQDIADRFGVQRVTITMIGLNRTWAHIPHAVLSAPDDTLSWAFLAGDEDGTNKLASITRASERIVIVNRSYR